MIIFEVDYETHNSDGTLKEKAIYWIGSTYCTKDDLQHEDEIFEQLDSELLFNV